jgi:L-lactate utilization protein LutC
MESTKTVQELASELSKAFETKTRNNGDEFVSLKDGSPQWMTDAIHKAHGDKMPDDHIYRFCEMAADAMAECDREDEDSLREAIQAIEEPVYTHQIMKWFAGNYEYCDQAIEQGLWESGIGTRGNEHGQVTNLVAIGMVLHIQEVGFALLDALTEESESRD